METLLCDTELILDCIGEHLYHHVPVNCSLFILSNMHCCSCSVFFTHFSILCVTVAIYLYSPFAYVDPLHCNMAYLYLELLKDSLNEYAYAAELAGLNYDLQNTVYGMYVSIQNPPPPPPIALSPHHRPHAP